MLSALWKREIQSVIKSNWEELKFTLMSSADFHCSPATGSSENGARGNEDDDWSAVFHYHAVSSTRQKEITLANPNYKRSRSSVVRSIPIIGKLIHDNCASKTQWLSTQGDFVPWGISGQCLGRRSQLGGTTPGIQWVEAKDTVKSPIMHRADTKDVNSAEVEKLMKYGYFVCCCIPGI